MAQCFFPLGEMPDTVLKETLLFLTYDEIAKLRRVNWRFNSMGKYLLNEGFRSAERYHTKCLKEVRSKLPRRESERRKHALSRHCDILTAVETRISLLSMTFMKYVELDLCCFIPVGLTPNSKLIKGKVVDEIFTVLKTIKTDPNPPRAYEILQELRDISSMAMEYFDEHVVPTLKVQLPVTALKVNTASTLSTSYLSTLPIVTPSSISLGHSRFSDYSTPSYTSNRPSGLVTEPRPHKILQSLSKITKTHKRMRKSLRSLTDMQKQTESYKSAVEAQNKKLVDQDSLIEQQNELLRQQNTRLAEQEEKLAELSRRLIENEQKLDDLSQEKSKVYTETDRLKRKRSTSVISGEDSEDLHIVGPASKKKNILN